MRLVHEYNRDKVEHYLHRKHLEKIARLEEFDRRGELSDRTMLAEAYESESTNRLMAKDGALAEEYLRKALRIHLELFEKGRADAAERVADCYRQLGWMARRFGARLQAEQCARRAAEYERLAERQRASAEAARASREGPGDYSEIFARK